MSDTSRYAEHRYAGTTRGSPPNGYTTTDSPWAIGSTRVDGITVQSDVAGIVPGETVTYDCVFIPDSNQPAKEHIQRWRTLSDYLTYAADVLTFDPPGTQVFYREQYDGPSSLVRIAPLQADHDASWVDGDPPPTRDSTHFARWGVVTGGQATAPLEDTPARLQLETVTIAAAEPGAEAPVYETRQAVIAAAERNAF